MILVVIEDLSPGNTFSNRRGNIVKLARHIFHVQIGANLFVKGDMY